MFIRPTYPVGLCGPSVPVDPAKAFRASAKASAGEKSEEEKIGGERPRQKKEMNSGRKKVIRQRKIEDRIRGFDR
jgi:hypothetical protein